MEHASMYVVCASVAFLCVCVRVPGWRTRVYLGGGRARARVAAARCVYCYAKLYVVSLAEYIISMIILIVLIAMNAFRSPRKENGQFCC